MRLGFNDEGNVIVENGHGGSIVWNTQVFDKSDFAANVNLFRDINAFWAQLPQESQNIIWQSYQNIRDAFDNILESGRLSKRLIEQVSKLYSVMPMDKIGWWTDLQTNIVYPTSSALLNEHDQYDPNPSRTYIRKDYIGLVYLTIALRPMLPIWGEYLRRTRIDAGTEYKEYVAMELIKRTSVATSLPIERLRVYVDAVLKSDFKKSFAHVLTGLGSEETVEWMVARVCIRRLTVVNIDAHPTAGNIITNIHGFVNNPHRNLDRNFGGPIRDKKPDESSREEESSIMELYKVKQSVSMGDIEMYAAYAQNTHRLARHLDPDIEPYRIALCVKHAYRLEQMFIQKHHLAITQWVTRFVLPPQSIPCLSKIELLGVMGAVQAVLWRWGFHDMAGLLTASAVVTANVEIYSLEARQRISNETMEKLMRYYPHMDQSDKQKGSERKNNYASQSIALLTKEMALNLWQYNAPPTLVAHCQGSANSNRVSVPANIMELMAQMVAFLAEKENNR